MARAAAVIVLSVFMVMHLCRCVPDEQSRGRCCCWHGLGFVFLPSIWPPFLCPPRGLFPISNFLVAFSPFARGLGGRDHVRGGEAYI